VREFRDPYEVPFGSQVEGKTCWPIINDDEPIVRHFWWWTKKYLPVALKKTLEVLRVFCDTEKPSEEGLVVVEALAEAVEGLEKGLAVSLPVVDEVDLGGAANQKNPWSSGIVVLLLVTNIPDLAQSNTLSEALCSTCCRQYGHRFNAVHLEHGHDRGVDQIETIVRDEAAVGSRAVVLQHASSLVVRPFGEDPYWELFRQLNLIDPGQFLLPSAHGGPVVLYPHLDTATFRALASSFLSAQATEMDGGSKRSPPRFCASVGASDTLMFKVPKSSTAEDNNAALEAIQCFSGLPRS
jgi:hypothetical protein